MALPTSDTLEFVIQQCVVFFALKKRPRLWGNLTKCVKEESYNEGMLVKLASSVFHLGQLDLNAVLSFSSASHSHSLIVTAVPSTTMMRSILN